MASDPSSDKPDAAMQTPLVERREYERVRTHIKVVFRDARHAGQVLWAYSLSLSAGGICLKTQKVYDVGSSLRISLGVDNKTYELDGTVAWVRDGAVGVRFENVTSSVRDDLRRLVTSLKRAPKQQAE